MTLDEKDLTPTEGDTGLQTELDPPPAAGEEAPPAGEEKPPAAGEEAPPAGEEEPKELTLADMNEKMEKLEKHNAKLEKRQQYLQRTGGRRRQATKVVPAELPKPDEEDYTTTAEFIDAQFKYNQNQEAIGKVKAGNTQVAAEQEEDFDTLISAGQAKYPDFDEKCRTPTEEGGPKITPAMLEAMMECEDEDMDIDIAYWLGTNVRESHRIAALPPVGQGREIGKIEAQLSGGVKPVVPQKTKTKPVTPSSPAEGKTVSSGKLEDMSIDDFWVSRNKADGVA